MLTIKLAFKNLLGAGLRTWLNVAALSFSYVIIVLYNGLIDGWNEQSMRDTKAWEIGSGQLWHPQYDQFDPLTLQDAHAPVSTDLQQVINKREVTPVLAVQATVYPQGRMQNVILRGIDPLQKIVEIPSSVLADTVNGTIPVLIGKRMAHSMHLKKGDRVIVRWRDKNNTFDAQEVQVAGIFDCNVSAVDAGQIWLSLQVLQKMTGMENEVTYLITSEAYKGGNIESWKYQSADQMTAYYQELIKSKKGTGQMMYLLLLALALLAIFDTQVLSIFRRQKEIGTYIALGMTRWQVVRIFTLEGSLNSVLAAVLAAIYGIPLLAWIGKAGFTMPSAADSIGISVAESIIPVYTASMVISTILLVFICSAIVSFLPTRKIARMNPTNALKGKVN